MYKKAEASFWTAEELDLAHDYKVRGVGLQCGARWGPQGGRRGQRQPNRAW
jgi:hypothetical protein